MCSRVRRQRLIFRSQTHPRLLAHLRHGPANVRMEKHTQISFQKAKVRKRQRNFRRCHNQVSLLLFILFALYQDGSLQRQPSSPEIPTMYAYFPTGSGADVLGLRLEFKPSPLNRTFLEASQFSGREPS